MTSDELKALIKQHLVQLVPKERNDLARLRDYPALQAVMDTVLRATETIGALTALPAPTPVEVVSASGGGATGRLPTRAKMPAIVHWTGGHVEITVDVTRWPTIGEHGTLDIGLRLPARIPCDLDRFALHCLELQPGGIGAHRRVGRQIDDLRRGDVVPASFDLTPERRTAWRDRLAEADTWPFRFVLTGVAAA